MTPVESYLRGTASSMNAFADQLAGGVSPVPQPNPQPNPQPVPPPVPTIPGYDFATHGILAEGWDLTVDPVGLPKVGVLTGIIGVEHTIRPAPYFLTSGQHCILYSGCLYLPSASGFQSGKYQFRLAVKSTGYLHLNGHAVWELIRGASGNYVVTEFEIDLLTDKAIGVDALLSNQNSAGEGYELRWRGPGITVPSNSPDGYADIQLDQLYLPADWKARLKSPVPPPPPPPPTPNPPQYIPLQPVTYETPELLNGGLVYPVDHPWMTKISDWEVDPDSEKILATMPVRVHMGFGKESTNGLPINVSNPATDLVIPEWKNNYYLVRNGEGDPGPYRIPKNVVLENAGIRFPNGWGPTNEGSDPEYDVHMITLSYEDRIVYEAYQTEMNQSADGKPNGEWRCLSAMKFPFDSIEPKPLGHTSTDASGMSVFGGLILFQQLRDGYIGHAIRTSVPKTRNGFVFPATHFTTTGGGPESYYPPMGTRMRLKRGAIDTSNMHPWGKTIITCLEDFGIIVVDNGGPFLALMGSPDNRLDDKILAQVRNAIPDVSKCFEVLKLGFITYAV